VVISFVVEIVHDLSCHPIH